MKGLDMKRKIILLGPPGAGKGTQAKNLCRILQIPHISTGDMLRQARSEGSDLGKLADQYLGSGQLVPDDVVNGIVAQRLKKEQNGFLLDGYPRTLGQAQALQDNGQEIDAVVLIDVADALLIERIVHRLSCSQCGCIYHAINMPPKAKNLCDACGVSLIQRSDDKEEVVRERLKVYHDQTAPLIDFYSKQGLVFAVDGAGSVDTIQENILTILG